MVKVITGNGNMSDKYELKPVDLLSWYGLLNSMPKQWEKTLQTEPAVVNTLDENRCLIRLQYKQVTFILHSFYMCFLQVSNIPTCILITKLADFLGM